MRLSLIAAVAKNGVIGHQGKMPWPKLVPDLERFKKLTLDHTVVMGRKTYQSIRRPLPRRVNLIVTRDLKLVVPRTVMFDSLEPALRFAYDFGENECFVIGGGEIYREMIYKADRLYITHIDRDFDGDVFFPKIDERQWKEVERSAYLLSDNSPDWFHYWFSVYERKKI